MIKDVFVPAKVGSKYIFARRVISFDINKTHIYACQIYLSGKHATIEKWFEQLIEAGTPADYKERVSAAITAIVAQCDRYDSVYTTLNSAQTVFKKLTLPFVDSEKIKMVAPFEVEPLLPFPVHTAALDFIITNVNTETKSTEVFIAAVQNQVIAQHLEYFELAGVNTENISIDIIALYGLFKLVPSLQQQTGSVAVVDMNSHETRIMYIHNGTLHSVRTIPKGLVHLAKKISTVSEVPAAEVMEHLIRFGLEQANNTKLTDAIKTVLANYWKEINFTLSSFAAQSQAQEPIAKVVLLGTGAQIKNQTPFITEQINIPCQLFTLDELTTAKQLSIKNKGVIPSSLLVSISAAIPSNITQSFNLKTGEFSSSNTSLLTKQLVVASLLFVLLMAGLFAHSYWQTRKLNSEYASSKQEVVSLLKEKFTAAEDETDTEEIRDVVEKEVRDQKKLWFGLANPSRLPLLKYLLELTNLVDKEAIGFEPEQITLTPEIITLKGRVRDFDALKVLERDLSKSELFVYIEPQDNPVFTMQIKLASQGGTGS